jgi:hypothetical protein
VSSWSKRKKKEKALFFRCYLPLSTKERGPWGLIVWQSLITERCSPPPVRSRIPEFLPLLLWRSVCPFSCILMGEVTVISSSEKV